CRKPIHLSKPEPEYQKALAELLSLEFTGMKLGLDNIRELLAILGNPQKKFVSIHIAGSNGKGSVSAMLAAAMQANGYVTGLYTSPHLVDFRERIKIDGKLITEEYISSFLEKIWKHVERLHATFFEVTTALAFSYFADSGVQIAVIETGLGGRLDATNVLESPLATVITSISLEHMEQLGNTLEEIAGEKAGIMKPGSPAIVNVVNELREVFLVKAKNIGTSVQFISDFNPSNGYQNLEAPFPGHHQEQNLRTALAVLDALQLPLKIELSIQGIAATKKLTGIRARLEEYEYLALREKKLKLILDVGHNPDAFKFLKEYFIAKDIMPIVIAGFANDKDIQSVIKEISQFASKFVAVAAHTHRAMPADILGEISREAGIETIVSSEPKNGVDSAFSIAKEGEVLLLAGSHFVVGDFLKAVEG
ncbi:MAG: bifunctional folylpolyglutamate synthase/dihydrofolate synthase, partial [Candidatus Kapaibacterium sp.]